MTDRTKITGRGWAYLGAVLGGAVSIAANVAHSYVPPPDTAASWSPHAGAVVGAVFWPVALFVAVEIFARTAWPIGKRWTALRFLGLLPVAVVAAVVSYRHLSGLLAFYREDSLTATIGPFAVDGIMVMATGALIAAGTRRTTAPVEAQPITAATAATVPVADSSSAPVPVSARRTPAPAIPTAGAKRAPKRQPSAAERVAKAAARTPDASPAQIAARLKLSERTVQRHMPKPDDSVSTPGLRVA